MLHRFMARKSLLVINTFLVYLETIFGTTVVIYDSKFFPETNCSSPKIQTYQIMGFKSLI